MERIHGDQQLRDVRVDFILLEALLRVLDQRRSVEHIEGLFRGKVERLPLGLRQVFVDDPIMEVLDDSFKRAVSHLELEFVSLARFHPCQLVCNVFRLASHVSVEVEDLPATRAESNDLFGRDRIQIARTSTARPDDAQSKL